MDKSLDYNLYKDIQARTDGEIYLGVVGPVRTGKSTLIKRFLEEMVLPQMEESPEKDRTRDQMPQSASGRTIMTTEPKFIPKDGVSISLNGEVPVKVRLIDCVGYMVEGAVGHEEDGEERMVRTPWFDYEIPFSRAAELGTRKVIEEHSTIGIVVITDGSIGEIPRNKYLEAEEKTICELKALGKPFVIVLNSLRPHSAETLELAESLSGKYGKPVLPVSCEQMKKDDINLILENVLLEFPVNQLHFQIPKWMELLPMTHPMKRKVMDSCRILLDKAECMKDLMREYTPAAEDRTPGIRGILRTDISLSEGKVTYQVQMDEDCYYRMLSEYAGVDIEDDRQLIRMVSELSAKRSEYERVESAIEEVRAKGYGIVIPGKSDIRLDEPEVVKQGNKFGVRMRAFAPSIHMIKADIQTEIAPIVGSEQQAEDLIQYIKAAELEGEEGIWETNIFGKSIGQIVNDGIQVKTNGMSEACQQKLQGALQKIVNTNSNGLICIVI